MAQDTSQHIKAEREDKILRISFARPEKRNAFTLDMYSRVVELMDEAANDDEIRVVLFRGEGQTFTSGNDLGDFMKRPPTSSDTPVFQLLLRLSTFEKPVVAAVQGAAVGIGSTMLLHCDLIYAGRSAVFQLPFVNLGLVSEGGSSLLLPRMVGHARAAEVLMLGDKFGPEQAASLGFVTRVVADEDLETEAMNAARSLAAKAPGALRETKRLMRASLEQPIRDALEREGAVFMKRLLSPEAAEAFRAFFEKRAPKF